MTSSPKPLSLVSRGGREEKKLSGEEERLSLIRQRFSTLSFASFLFSLSTVANWQFNRETDDRALDKNYKCTVQLFRKKKISGFFSKCKETCFALGCLLVPCGVSPARKPQMWFEKWKQFVDIRVWQHELLLIETSIQCQWWWGRIRGEFYHSDRCGFNQGKKTIFREASWQSVLCQQAGPMMGEKLWQGLVKKWLWSQLSGGFPIRRDLPNNNARIH